MQSDWPTATLGELTINLDTKRRPVKEADRRSGPYPYYGASGIVDHVDGFLFEGEHLLIAEDGENLRTRNTPVAFRATGRFWVNNHAHIVKGNGLARTRFLEYAVLAADLTPYLTGAVMPKLTQGNLNKIELPCPPLKAQDAVIGVLGSLDDRISLLRQTNATLESIAQALFKSWFIDFDPVRAKAEGREPEGMDAATAALFPSEFEDSELGPIPKGWQVEQIGKLVRCLGGATPSTRNESFWQGGTHHWATPKDMSGLPSPALVDTDRRITDEGLSRISSGLLPAGTLLLSSRAPIGYLAISAVPTAINQGFIAMPPGGDLSPMFLLCWCKENMGLIKQSANGSTFMEISKKAFRPLPVCVPTIEIRGAFDQLAVPIFDKIKANELHRCSLTELRDTLLPRLISGKLRLSDAEREIEAATA